jgi:ornithine cyclodeaminase
MRDNDILMLKGDEIDRLLADKEQKLIDVVRKAYEIHNAGKSSLPHSTFLRFPDNPANRIIALPTYLGGEFEVAGVKWVSSFPGNVGKGLDRASAVVILNSTETGRPKAIMEGSIISAKRTAASAALAARHLPGSGQVRVLSLIGCGPIGFEIVRFVRASRPEIDRLVLFDLDSNRANQFKEKCKGAFKGLEVDIVSNVKDALSSSTLVSFATTAATPHVSDISGMAAGSTILHISLRDLAPEVILSCDNIADDIDHVCRAQTSVHLAEQVRGNRDFIRCTLADITSGAAPPRRDEESIAVFSPFGLGVLDLAVAQFLLNLAADQGLGSVISSFLPAKN